MSTGQALGIADIIRRAGGPKAIVDEINGDEIERSKISAWAIYKWPAIGIPDQHWPAIIKLANVTAEQLYQANQAARAEAAA